MVGPSGSATTCARSTSCRIPDTLEVFGVLARQGDRVVAIKARRALVMCTGGYEANVEMQRDYGGYERVYPFGSPANTGDGIKMLQKAGADLWHLRNRNESAGNPPGIKTPEYTAPFKRNPRITAWSWIDIAKDNRRFHNESEDSTQNHYRIKKHGHWSSSALPFAMPVHMIFDDSTRAKTSIADTFTLANWSIVVEGYRWSADNTAEIERGWISRADSLREPRGFEIGRDPDEVEATINQYNDACASGVDSEYGRRRVVPEPDRRAAVLRGRDRSRAHLYDRRRQAERSIAGDRPRRQRHPAPVRSRRAVGVDDVEPVPGRLVSHRGDALGPVGGTKCRQ